MSLGGIAIAIGAMVDAAIVMIENAHKRLERAAPDKTRSEVIIDAAVQVGPALFFSLLIITCRSCRSSRSKTQEGRLFKPLAYTKTFAMAAAAFIAFDLDRLFRSERRSNADVDYPRAGAARILPTTSACSRRIALTWFGMSSQTGVAQPDAERRVEEVAARAKENIARARRSVAVIAFAAGAGTYSGLPPPGSPRMPVGAFATVRPRLTRCGTGEGRFGAPDDRFDPLSLLVAHPLPKTNQDRVVRAEN
jgi:multidrug efflux pump subunit AcrB